MRRKLNHTNRLLMLVAMSLFGMASALAQNHSQPLNTAIRDGDLKQVKTLLAKGAAINAPGCQWHDAVDVCRPQRWS